MAKIVQCNNCKGTGKKDGEACPVCKGKGYLVIKS